MLSNAFESGTPPEGAGISVQAWNIMGGAIDWQALPIVAEILGVEDIEMLITHLIAIRSSKGG